MKRKILSLVLVVAMLASMLVFVPAAGAETAPTVEVTKTTAYAGDTVTLDVIVTSEKLTGFMLMFEYDRSRLDLVMNGNLNYTAETAFYNATVTDNANENSPWTRGDNALFESIYWLEASASPVTLDGPTKIGTLTFKVKDKAAAGDAYVAFRYVHGDAPDATGKIQPDWHASYLRVNGPTDMVSDKINYVAGGVTVLPEGYVDGTPTADDDFMFTPEYFSLDAYVGSAANVVVPSQIGGVEVQEIYASGNSGAFTGVAGVKSIVIPATATLIYKDAATNCSDLTDIYILGANTELSANSIGYSASWDSRGQMFKNYVKNEGLVIHGLAGSTAETYANENGFTFVADAPAYSVTVDGATYLVGADAVAPGAKVNGDQLTVAWKNGDEVIKPGAAMNLTADAILTPVTITSPTINEGVSFKVSAGEAGLAMRFTADLLKADYEKLASLGDVTLGMLIAPEINIKLAGAFTMPALEAISTTPYVKIDVGGFYKELDDAYVLAGSISNFSNKTLNNNPKFAAVAFASVALANGETITVYGNYNHNANRDVLTVAEAAALDTSTYTTTECGWIANLITKFAQ